MNANIPEVNDIEIRRSARRKVIKAGLAAFLIVVVLAILFQFFLQFALAGDYSKTAEFWIDGIKASLVYGIPLGLVFVLPVGYLVSNRELRNSKAANAPSRIRSLLTFTLIVLLPFALAIGCMLILVFLVPPIAIPR